MWGLLIWTLVAPLPDPRDRSLLYRGHSHVGVGRGGGGGARWPHDLFSGTRVLAGQSPLPGVSGAVPEFGSSGHGAVLLRLVASE